MSEPYLSYLIVVYFEISKKKQIQFYEDFVCDPSMDALFEEDWKTFSPNNITS